MRVTNGPVGVGMGDGTESPEATSPPMTIGLVAGFDPALAADCGDIIGSETATCGQHVLEGPGLCLHRVPTAGRTFVYLSEEIDEVPAVLEAWNQGSEDGHVAADILLGAANPCGKLPTTYARSADDLPTAGHPERYPGADEGDGYPVMRYGEGLRMGYRWYRSEGVEPLFPFGHGLSYTTFELTDLAVDAGARPGSTPSPCAPP